MFRLVLTHDRTRLNRLEPSIVPISTLSERREAPGFALMLAVHQPIMTRAAGGGSSVTPMVPLPAFPQQKRGFVGGSPEDPQAQQKLIPSSADRVNRIRSRDCHEGPMSVGSVVSCPISL